jgi:urease accessory protein
VHRARDSSVRGTRYHMTPTGAPRDHRAWDRLSHLPEELVVFDEAIRGGLGVGAPGKVGVLELGLVAADGVTRVQRHYQQAPLHVFRSIHLDPGRPDMAFIFVQQSGDGYVQGDRCRVDLDCGPGAAAHVTTQAATKVFAARQNVATQLVNLDAAANAVLEYLPDPVVPCRGSRFFQRIDVTADERATVILGETLLPGRVAHGERHDYDLYWSETEVRRPDATLLFADVLRLSPADGTHPMSIGLCGSHDVVASLYVVTSRIDPPELVAVFRAALAVCPQVVVGVSELPNDCGVVARVLGCSSKAVQAAVTNAWSEARLALLGAPAPNLRKG